MARWIVCLALVACTPTVTSAPLRHVVVAGPPPDTPAGERPPPPSSTAAWVDGRWHWTGVEYVWMPGHWEAAPPGAHW